MLMYEALMHRLVRRHIAGAGFVPTTMARLSVLRDIYGMPVHTRTSRKIRPLMPSSPTCFLGLKDATWLTTGWTFWQWYGLSFILTEGRFIYRSSGRKACAFLAYRVQHFLLDGLRDELSLDHGLETILVARAAHNRLVLAC